MNYLSQVFDRLAFLTPTIKETLQEFIFRLKKTERENLLQVILFGSMARGDFDDESDTDVFILLKDGEEKTFDIAALAYNTAYDICYNGHSLKPFVLLSPFVETLSSMMQTIHGIPRWKLEPVFQSIKEEGVLLYASDQRKKYFN